MDKQIRDINEKLDGIQKNGMMYFNFKYLILMEKNMEFKLNTKIMNIMNLDILYLIVNIQDPNINS